MSDDRDDDDDYRRGFPFFGGFSGFGGFFREMDKQFQDMDRYFEDMSRQMEHGFKDFGEIRAGFHPPNVGGNVPPHQQDPRDQMLKGNDDGPSVSQSQPSGGSSFVWSSPETRIVTGNSDNYSVNGTSSFRFTQTVRHADGTIERTEKTTRNGQTCTTVTKTDPQGVSTTTTTCDRPAIEGSPRLTSPNNPPTSDTIRPERGNIVPSVNTELTKEDANFFSKLFGNFGFKPKS